MKFLGVTNKTGFFILAAVAVILAVSLSEYAYSDVESYMKRKSYAASPGYLNAAKQKTDEIINQAPKKNTFFEGVVEHLKNGLSRKVDDIGQNNVDVDLKKKSGSSEGDAVGAITAADIENNIIDSTLYNVAIGTGTPLEYDANGRLIAEEINGIKHIYVGFTEVGAQDINTAMALAHIGDIVLVAGGREYRGVFAVKDGVRLYGGYQDDGTRDIRNSETKIIGGFSATGIRQTTEINGFTIQSANWAANSGARIALTDCSDSLKILNNRIKDAGGVAISAENSQSVLYNNQIEGGLALYAGPGFLFIFVNKTQFAIMSSNSSLTVSNNFIIFTGRGIMETEGSSSVFTNNVLVNNTWGFTVMKGSTTLIDNNTIRGTIAGPLSLGIPQGITVSGAAPIVTNNIFDGTFRIFDLKDGVTIGEGGMIIDGNIFPENLNCLNLDPLLVSNDNSFLNLYDSFNLETYQYSADLSGKGFTPGGVKDFNAVNLKDFMGQGPSRLSIGLYGDNTRILKERLRKFSIERLKSDYFDRASDKAGQKEFIPGKIITALVKGVSKLKENMSEGDEKGAGDLAMKELVENVLKESALSIPAGGISELKPQEIEIAAILASVLSNPTEDQKKVVEVLTGLVEDMANIDGSVGSKGLTQANNDLIQMFTAILLAQALPDLLKEDDISSVRQIFFELNDAKSQVMLEYKKSIGSYYDSIIKELARNIVILQMKGILSKSMTEDALGDMPRSEIDKILSSIKNISNKTEEEDSILAKDAEYKERYVSSADKTLQENMRILLQSFTQKLNDILEKGVKPAEAGTEISKK